MARGSLARALFQISKSALVDLVVASALQHEDGDLQSGGDFGGIVTAQIEKVRAGDGRAEEIHGVAGLQRGAFDLGGDGLGFLNLLLVLWRLRGGQAGDVLDLVDHELFQRPRRAGQNDDAGDLRVFGGNARREHASQAVAEDVNLLLVDLRHFRQQGDGGDGVVGDFIFHRERRVGLGVGPILLGALYIAQNRNVLAGQSVGQVGERLVGTDGFVGILRAGAMHQHDGRYRRLGIGKRENAGQLPTSADDGGVAVVEGVGLDVSRRFPFACGWGCGSGVGMRLEEEALHLTLGIHIDLGVEDDTFELAGDKGGVQALLLRNFDRCDALEGPGLRQD